jgi:diguanylate cyclase (GGDEF)-like protein
MNKTTGQPGRGAERLAAPGAWERMATAVLCALRLDSLDSRVTALALIATLVPSLSMGCLFYIQNKRLLDDKIAQELHHVTTQAAREIDLRMRERLYDVRVFSTSTVVTEAMARPLGVSRPGAATHGRLEEYLRSVCAKFSDYEELLVVDPQGNVLATSAEQGGPSGLPEGWVQLAGTDRPIVGQPYVDPRLQRSVVTIAGPVRSLRGDFLGALAAKLDLEALGEILALYSADSTSDISLVDRQGRTLANPTRGAREFMRADLAPPVVERLFAEEGAAVPHAAHGQATVGSLQRLQQLDWGVLAQLEQSRAYAQIARLRNLTIGLVSGIMLAVGCAAYLLGLTVARPLDRLAKGSARVAGGDLGTRLPVLGRGEVAYLTDAFNKMVLRLAEGRKKLDETNEALRSKNEELQRFSTTDSLTGLHNRHSLMDLLAAELERSRRGGRPFGLLMIDVDHFKRFNDSHGHLAGDAILRKLGTLLESELRSCDHAARYGGEEFVVLLTEADLASSMLVAERIRARAETSLRVDGISTAVTLSLGLAVHPEHATEPEDLLRQADEALYEAKRAGRNGVAVAARRESSTRG